VAEAARHHAAAQRHQRRGVRVDALRGAQQRARVVARRDGGRGRMGAGRRGRDIRRRGRRRLAAPPYRLPADVP